MIFIYSSSAIFQELPGLAIPCYIRTDELMFNFKKKNSKKELMFNTYPLQMLCFFCRAVFSQALSKNSLIKCVSEKSVGKGKKLGIDDSLPIVRPSAPRLPWWTTCTMSPRLPLVHLCRCPLVLFFDNQYHIYS
jgi:hypothetical protein